MKPADESCHYPVLMRAAFCLLLAFSCATVTAGRELQKRAPAFQSGGQDYVQLEHWAEANHFAFTGKGDAFQVSSRWTKLDFKPNSLRAEINGVALYLAFPILARPEGAFIAREDLDRSVTPILFPDKSRARPAVKVVAISAGHGGKDSGVRVGSYQEKDFTLLLAQELRRLTARAGLKPVMIRSTDKLVELEDKTDLAKRYRADVFLELHYNSAGTDNDVRGVEVYCMTPPGAHSTNGGSNHYGNSLPGNKHDERNVLLAYEIHRSLVQDAGLADRGVRRARFQVLREAEMPAVLIEAGFMSQPGEMRQIRDAKHRRKTAQAILDGLLTYKRRIER